ncbi:MAG TPA: asparagine synthase (glutamine-hydrolyzing) [bacterium]|nr:asparagine synthase (glutamine-hydrolyzing) [bacterium]
MCGFCGVIHTDSSETISDSVVEHMLEVLEHRGPDDQEFYFNDQVGFGHCRLSIIDLSKNASQPMPNREETLWLMYNGEIYNYLELRQSLTAQGYQFKSHSDTEVIIYLYEEYGEQAVQHLNGMFAFTLWDTRRKQLFVARDRFGIKPFYYFFDGRHFIFGSEIKSLLQHPAVPAEVDYQGLADYFTFQFCLGEKTLFKNIQTLEPAHTLTFNVDGRIEKKEYWNLDYTIDADHTADYFESTLLRLLEDTVRIELRADVPVGAHLSGGLDSSTMTALAASLLDSKIHTFSGGFKDGEQYDETRYAQIVSKANGTIHHEIYPTARNFVETLQELIYFMDEPAGGPGIFPQYFVSKLAGENVKVVLGGQGGDEMFGGYTRYLIAYLEECIKGGIEGSQEDSKYVVTFDSILPNLAQLQGYEPMLKYFWEENLFQGQAERYYRLINRSESVRHLLDKEILDRKNYDPFDEYNEIFNGSNSRSYINKMTYFDQKTLLPALLHVEDRTSMAVSLESRVPLLDHRIAELVASMPPKIKYAGGRAKYIFRKVAEHIVPQAISNRKDKMGFPVPLSEWYQDGPVRDFIIQTLMSQSARERGIYDIENIEPTIKNERAFGRGIWGLLNIELWMQTFIDSH